MNKLLYNLVFYVSALRPLILIRLQNLQGAESSCRSSQFLSYLRNSFKLWNRKAYYGIQIVPVLSQISLIYGIPCYNLGSDFLCQVLFAPIRATSSASHNVVFSSLLLLPIMYKYFPRRPVLEHPRFHHFPQCKTKFHTLAKTRRNNNFVYYCIYIFLLKKLNVNGDETSPCCGLFCIRKMSERYPGIITDFV